MFTKRVHFLASIHCTSAQGGSAAVWAELQPGGQQRHHVPHQPIHEQVSSIFACCLCGLYCVSWVGEKDCRDPHAVAAQQLEGSTWFFTSCCTARQTSVLLCSHTV